MPWALRRYVHEKLRCEDSMRHGAALRSAAPHALFALCIAALLHACGAPQKINFEAQPASCKAVELVRVPAGRYLIGCGVTRACPHAGPLKVTQFEAERWETVATFLIERAEATEGDFYGCTCGVDCERPPAFPDLLDRPCDEFNYDAAEKCCAKKAMRLPTNIEWEAAAGGPAHFEFSWGNAVVDFEKMERNSEFYPHTDVKKSIFPKARTEASAFGTMGMSGGPSEFVQSDRGLAKGSSTITDFGNARFKVFFGEIVPFAGVRCVK